ncbi:hypothetical protein [Paenibacillus sp. JJ-223]|uniref:hypothetical protein n=1 Tax=Paenibacillus sp. JJ-223 TaxID=2905647 RepID=UPI001F2E305C|nr:hypothetical protein [Paenibacillus sp. JJ-223]CAH1205342.1 hypothetical protein PAECIP111890_02642 [Paenibacillus sp. JJ-223]
MTATNIEALTVEYTKLIEREDEALNELTRCRKLISDAMDIIAKQAGVLEMDTVKQAAYHLHSMEQELNRKLFEIRLEKSMLAYRISHST